MRGPTYTSPFDVDEQKALVALWRERLTLGPSDSSQDDLIKQWIDARKKVPTAGAEPSIDVFRQMSEQGYEQYVNCTGDGFRTAILTLDQRIAKFGANSKTVEEWLGAQDQVFSNCSYKPPGFQSGKENPSVVETIPVSLQSGAGSLARADREYQIAAAYFYAAKFDEAGKRFQAIAQDPASPWRQIAALLVARSLIRKTTLSSQEDKYDKSELGRAEKQLKQILGDAKLREMQPSAQRLVDFIELRIHPYETERSLASRLVQEHVGQNLKQNLWDYTTLLDKLGPDYPELRDLQQGGDLSDWLVTFQDSSQTALDHSLEKWTQTHSLPWLVASLSKVKAGQSAVPQLLLAAEKVPPSSPAYATVAFHRLRLLSEADQSDEVRTRLDKLLSQDRKLLPPSSLNLFLALRLKVATNLEEFLRFAQRVPATVFVDTEGMELPDDAGTPVNPTNSQAKEQVLLDADSTEILNKMLPLDVLAQAAESKTLSDDLRRQIALAAWVRAILLDDGKVSGQMLPILESLEPALKHNLETYRVEKSADSAKFDAVFLMLKYPGTRPIVDFGVSRKTLLNEIDNFRDNWWCIPGEGAKTDPGQNPLPLSKPLRVLYQTGEPASPLFLDAEQKRRGQEEWRKLQHLGVAPNYLAEQVLAWAKDRPDDPRVAEALYLVIRSTRYGCKDKDTGGLSKASFQFLHAHYPKSEWAMKTKYWYGSGSGGH
jgi:hypothetical protein